MAGGRIGRGRAFLLFFVCLGGLCVRPAAAYWDDVHYFLTYIIARYAGFTPAQAYRVSAANLFIDYNDRVKPDQVPKDTNELTAILQGRKRFPEGLLRPRWRFHAFRDESRFEDVIGNDPKAEEAEKAVGEEENRRFESAQGRLNPGFGLHFVQDRFCHQKFGSIWAHLFNPLDYEKTTEKARASGLPIGGTVDWLSALELEAAFDLISKTAGRMQEFLRQNIPLQKQPDFELFNVQDIVKELRNINVRPDGLTLEQMPLYAAYYLAEEDKNIKTKIRQDTFAANYRKITFDLADTLVRLAFNQIPPPAPALTQAQKDFFYKHKYGPNLAAAGKAVLDEMTTKVFAECATAAKVREFLDLEKARNKYTFDADNQVQPRDELILAGNLDLSIEGVLTDPKGRVEVALKVPATRTGETEYAFGDSRSMSPGEKGTWEKVPVGEASSSVSPWNVLISRPSTLTDFMGAAPGVLNRKKSLIRATRSATLAGASRSITIFPSSIRDWTVKETAPKPPLQGARARVSDMMVILS